MKKVKNHYADNKVIYPVLKEYVEQYRKAEKEGTELPRISNRLGKVIKDIADGLALRPNFSGYSYIDEMKSDGIIDCMKYIHKFDYEKYDKPYSYINRIIWQAFVRRIDREKKEQYMKYKLQMNGDIYMEHTADIQDKIQTLQDKFEPKKKKEGIEKFLD